MRSLGHVDLLGFEASERPDHWQRGGYVFSADGALGLEWWLRQNRPRASGSTRRWAYSTWLLRLTRSSSWHGFDYEATSWDNSGVSSDGRPTPSLMTYNHRVSVPHWFVLALMMTPVALWLRGAARRRRARIRRSQNVCTACGYDLHASPGRCPECGREVPSTSR